MAMPLQDRILRECRCTRTLATHTRQKLARYARDRGNPYPLSSLVSRAFFFVRVLRTRETDSYRIPIIKVVVWNACATKAKGLLLVAGYTETACHRGSFNKEVRHGLLLR